MKVQLSENKLVAVCVIAGCLLIYIYALKIVNQNSLYEIHKDAHIFVDKSTSQKHMPITNDLHLKPPTQQWIHQQFKKALKLLGYNSYNGNNSWTECQHPRQTYFFPNIKTVFTGIPKSGCSNWIEALLRAEGVLAQPLSSTEVSLVHGKMSSIFRMSSYDEDTNTKNTSLISSFSFTVLRNPWTRMVSGYRDKLSEEITQGHHFKQHKLVNIAKEGHIHSADEVESQNVYPTFEDYLNFLLLKNGTGNIHFMPQHKMLCVPQSSYDYVVPLEYSSLLHDDVFRRFNTSVRLLESYDNAPDPRTQSSTLLSEEWFSKIDQSIIDALYKLYEADFVLLNYSNFSHPDFPLPLYNVIE